MNKIGRYMDIVGCVAMTAGAVILSLIAITGVIVFCELCIEWVGKL